MTKRAGRRPVRACPAGVPAGAFELHVFTYHLIITTLINHILFNILLSLPGSMSLSQLLGKKRSAAASELPDADESNEEIDLQSNEGENDDDDDEDDDDDQEEQNAKKRRPYFGAQHSIWKQRKGAGWEPCAKGTSSKAKGTKSKENTIMRDSIIARYRREGGLLNAKESCGNAIEMENPFIAAAMATFRGTSEDRQNKSFQQTVDWMACMECFFLEAMPNSAFAKSLRDMLQWLEPGGDKTRVVPIGVMQACEVLSFYSYITSSGIVEGLGVPGRECGNPSLEKYSSIISWLSKQSDVTDPCAIDSVKTFTKHMREKHESRHAPSLDFVEMLPRLKAAVWEAKGTYLSKLQSWTMILVQINLIGRGSEVCQYCPEYSDFAIPQLPEEYDADGTPKFVTVVLKDWKGRKNARCEFHLARNPVNPDYCPVLHLLTWLRLSKITHGPLFAMTAGSEVLVAHEKVESITRQGKETYWITRSGERVNHTFDAWAAHLVKLFADCGYPKGVTSHSIRRSGAQWAARCGATEPQIKATARWSNNSSSYYAYIQAGHQDKDKWATLRKPDPIRQLWVFHPAVWTQTITSRKA